MTSTASGSPRHHTPGGDDSRARDSPRHKTTSDSQDDPMDDAAHAQPEHTNSPAPSSTNGTHAAGSATRGANANGSSQATGAAAAAQQQQQQPKVQTAFIHKLYNMLEDQSIRHLITWSNSGESFLISPTAEFSKVLATYFKHTNVSSFVRQLNMYGFHKVSDVFHTGSPETALWEFKHGNGNFKRGDLAGLKEIKRRASRHALIHRDSFPTAAPKQTQPTPQGPPEPPQDSLETRMNFLAHDLMDVQHRLAMADQSLAFLHSKCQMLADNLTRSYQANIDLSSLLTTLVHDHDHPIHRQGQFLYYSLLLTSHPAEITGVASSFQTDIRTSLDMLRGNDMSQHLPPHERHPSFSQPAFEPGGPVSPRQLANTGSRRSSALNISAHDFVHPSGARSNTASPRRFLSSNVNGTFPRGISNAPLAPPPFVPGQAAQHYKQPAPPAPSAPSYNNPFSGNLLRRHTSADIRSDMNQQGPETLQPASNRSSIASGMSLSQLPSPSHRNSNIEDVQLRESLANYQLSGDGRRSSEAGPRRFSSSGTIRAEPQGSRSSSPPVPGDNNPNFHISGPGGNAAGSQSWNFQGPQLSFRDVFNTGSGPPTRRSSMAHILNPADTAEREDEDDVAPDELRKRKRVN